MGVFTRFRDIITSNLNSMLDQAEDPEKMIKLMIREMEDTLVEIKASCAGVMATRKRVQRQLNEARDRQTFWEDKTKLAVDKGRDDLAREALQEKRLYVQRVETLNREAKELQDIIDKYQGDIRQLEGKISGAREKQRVLVQRHIRAQRGRKAQEDIRRLENSEALLKFEKLENRIERMESEADLVNLGRKSTLEEEFAKLAFDDDIEKELATLKAAQKKQPEVNEE
jgi:phage shock protein A